MTSLLAARPVVVPARRRARRRARSSAPIPIPARSVGVPRALRIAFRRSKPVFWIFSATRTRRRRRARTTGRRRSGCSTTAATLFEVGLRGGRELARHRAPASQATSVPDRAAACSATAGGRTATGALGWHGAEGRFVRRMPRRPRRGGRRVHARVDARRRPGGGGGVASSCRRACLGGGESRPSTDARAEPSWRRWRRSRRAATSSATRCAASRSDSDPLNAAVAGLGASSMVRVARPRRLRAARAERGAARLAQRRGGRRLRRARPRPRGARRLRRDLTDLPQLLPRLALERRPQLARGRRRAAAGLGRAARVGRRRAAGGAHARRRRRPAV